jgi:hypothetical protein
MDEVEALLAQLTSGTLSSAAQRDARCNRLAECLIAIFFPNWSSSRVSVLGYPHGQAWARRLACPLLARPPARSVGDQLSGWAAVVTASLDDFYEAHVPRAELQESLVRGLRCASALTILRDEVCACAHVDDEAPGWLSAPERVGDALRSLEMEGFDVSVPPALRPATLPREGHGWWYAQTRQGYLGGVTNIR